MIRSEKDKMLAGENYFASDEVLSGERIKAKQLLYKLNVKEYVVDVNTRNTIAGLIPNAPPTLYIEPPFHCDYGYNIYCGENVYFNVNCVVLDAMKVAIGSNVFFGPNVQVYTSTHPLDAEIRRTAIEFARPVNIGDDCWIGGGAVICPGVTIGNKCIIGAGAVVTKNIPDGSLAVGNPAKVIRSLR